MTTTFDEINRIAEDIERQIEFANNDYMKAKELNLTIEREEAKYRRLNLTKALNLINLIQP